MFQRIARRNADHSDESSAPEQTGDEATMSGAPAEAPTEQLDAVAPAPIDQPTTLQPAAPVPGSEPAAPGEPAPASEQPVPLPAEATASQSDASAPPRRPGFRARGRMRRRLRYLRRLRDLQVRDLGGLVFDLRRFERRRDDLVAQKLDQLRACDDELRALELALGERRDLRDVREPGIGGTCPRCFAVFGSADRFCASCGAALGGAVQGPAQVPLTTDVPPPAAASSSAPVAPPTEATPASPIAPPTSPSPAPPPEATGPQQ